MPSTCAKPIFLRIILPLSAALFILMSGWNLAHASNGTQGTAVEGDATRNYFTYINERNNWFHSSLRELIYSGLLTASNINQPIRSAHLHPFSRDSIWNTSLGIGAKFENYSSLRNNDFRTGRSYINSDNGYGIEMNVANSSDPIRTVTYGERSKSFVHRIPESAVIVKGTDANLNVIEGRYIYEYWVVRRLKNGNYIARYGERTDLLGSGIKGGIRAARFSTNAGLIRKHEVENLQIPHALAMALPGSAIKKGWVWPASAEDESNDDYKGLIPIGSLFAIPPEVDLNKLGLSPEGFMLGRALQDYGAYVSDRASQVSLYASSDVEKELPDQFKQMVADFNNILRNEMRFVTNNMEFNVGGGGLRRQPAASSLIEWP